MYFYAGRPYIVATMPFHGISAYPSQTREHDADDPSRMQYELHWNGSFESGKNAQSYLVPLRPARDAAAGYFTRSWPASGKKRRRK